MTEREPADAGDAAATSSVTLTHVGGPTTLIEFAGWRILTDPTFDPPGKRYGFGWGTSSTKTSGPAVSVEELGPIDAVLLTHDHHADNLDDRGRELLSTVDTVVTTTSGARRLGGSLGDRVRGVDTWASTVLAADGRPSIDVTATPCRHGPPLSHPIVGDVVGFALRWDGQRDGALWVTGDTVLFDGVRQVGDRFDVGVAVLHLGQVRFGLTGPLRYTMGAADGLDLCRTVGATTIVPVHYEGWSHFSEGRAAIEAELAHTEPVVRDRVRWLTPGVPAAVDV